MDHIVNLRSDGTISNQPLEDSLKLSGPYNVGSAPNAYSFTRLRNIDVNWHKIFKDAGVSLDQDSDNALRDYILKNWGTEGYKKEVLEKNAFELTEKWPAYEHDPNSVSVVKYNLATGFYVFSSKAKWSNYRILPKASEVIKHELGCVFAFSTDAGTRYFKPIIVDERNNEITSPQLSDFTSKNKWEETWKKVDGLIQVFHPGKKPEDGDSSKEESALKVAKDQAMAAFPYTEVVRADASLILQQWTFLDNEEEIASRLAAKAIKIAEQMETAALRELPLLQEQYRELKSYGRTITEKRKSLADAAADLGYHLFVKDTPVTYIDEAGKKAPRELKKGTLYRRSLKTQTWTTYQTRSYTRRRLFSRRTYTYQVPIQHSKTFEFYEEAVIDNDPWVEVLDFYKENDYSVFFFIDTADGLRTADGSRPEDVFRLCESDEEFRKKCVVGLPIRELSIVGEEFLVGYLVIVRPTPEAIVSEFPNIELDESLSYRFTWTGVALGEMAATIPLSPGEEREVTIKTSKQFKSKRTDRTSSLIDVTRIDRSDFETVFEKEVQKEKEKTSQFSASASASYGVASGSASFSKSTRTKDVARQLNRSVQKASQEVNRRARDERTLEISESVETSESTSTSFKVSNINSGTTLNITFYRIMNSFASVLRLDAGQLLMRSGRSYFTSNDLRDANRFGDIENPHEACEAILNHLIESGEFPYDLSEQLSAGADAKEEQVAEIEKKKKLIVDGLVAAIAASNEDNFGSDGEPVAEKSIATMQQLILDTLEGSDLKALSRNETSRTIIQLLNLACTVDCKAEEEDRKIRVMSQLRDARDEALAREAKEQIGSNIEEVSYFAYDSGGLYADLIRGTNEGVEPYAESMRAAEVEKASADVRLIDARANYLLSKAGSNVGYLDFLDEDKVYCTAVSVLLLNLDNHPTVRVQIIPSSLPRHGWIGVFADGLGEFPIQKVLDGGVLEFLLPERFYSVTKIHKWSENDFEEKFSLRHLEHDIVLGYKKTPDILGV